MWIDDDILRRAEEKMALSCWVPSGRYVVLGSANQLDVEVAADACRAAGIPILRRYGGGGTVVLYPGCAVVSLGLWVRHHFQNGRYFELINRAVIDALAGRWPELSRLAQNGISDLVDGRHKVAGTSLFRSRNYVLYQASILVDCDYALIGRLLRHPSREPDYRKGRSHADFVRGLGDILPGALTPASCVAALQERLPASLLECLGDELIEPVAAQREHLDARLERAALEEAL